MAVGAGLSATAGIVTEATNGTAGTPTHFLEIDSESMKGDKNTVQGKGLRGGATGSGGGTYAAPAAMRVLICNTFTPASVRATTPARAKPINKFRFMFEGF